MFAVWPLAFGVSALPVPTIFSSLPSFTSHSQPLPNWPTPLALNSSLNLSKLPKALSMAPASAPLGLPPPPGFMQFQKKVWFHTWAAWLNRVPELDLMISSSDLLALSVRSEEHTSELQSLMRISYAVFCLQKKIAARIH